MNVDLSTRARFKAAVALAKQSFMDGDIDTFDLVHEKLAPFAPLVVDTQQTCWLCPRIIEGAILIHDFKVPFAIRDRGGAELHCLNESEWKNWKACDWEKQTEETRSAAIWDSGIKELSVYIADERFFKEDGTRFTAMTDEGYLFVLKREFGWQIDWEALGIDHKTPDYRAVK